MSKTSEQLGLEAGTGIQDSTESFIDWRVWIPMVLLNYAIVSSSGFHRHQETWNAQMSIVGSYNNIRNDVN